LRERERERERERKKKSKQDTNVIINHLPAVSAEAFKDLSASPHTYSYTIDGLLLRVPAVSR